MKNKSMKTICLILVLTFIFSFAVPVSAYYADASKIEITLTPGSTMMSVNGETSKIVKPRYMKGNILYVPLRPIMEAFGGEVTWKEGKKTEIAFRDVSTELTLLKTQYSANQNTKELEAAPIIAEGSLMVPVSFITGNFGIQKEKSGKGIKLILTDDGALNDLSFLTGGISKNYAGNSYYGWYIAVPKGSRIASLSFNSGYILIENQQRQIGIEVYVSSAEGKTLEEYYEMMSDNSGNYFDGDVLDSGLVEKAAEQYAQFLYTDSYDEAVVRRVFIKNDSVIALTVTSYSEADPARILNDDALISIINSFKTRYPAVSSDIQDVSRIKYGFAKYENYITSDSGKKYFTWEMDIIPAWNELMANSGQYYQEIGTSRKEYVSVEISHPSNSSGAEACRKETREQYERNFNKKIYSLIGEKYKAIGGEKAFGLDYSIKLGETTYIYNEWFISSSNMVYDVTFKCPKESYDERLPYFDKMFETFKVYTKDSENLLKDIDKYQFTQNKNRLGKDDSYTAYENKQFGWSAGLPGYWLKNTANDSDMEYFYSNRSFAAIAVQAIDTSSAPKDMPDEEKYSTLSDMINQDSVSEISREDRQLNGMPCTHIGYRMENEETDNYADINAYIIKGDKYSYCIISTIPDVCASDYNLQELDKILGSFKIKAESK